MSSNWPGSESGTVLAFVMTVMKLRFDNGKFLDRLSHNQLLKKHHWPVSQPDMLVNSFKNYQK
jgi:hypothetical protein